LLLFAECVGPRLQIAEKRTARTAQALLGFTQVLSDPRDGDGDGRPVPEQAGARGMQNFVVGDAARSHWSELILTN